MADFIAASPTAFNDLDEDEQIYLRILISFKPDVLLNWVDKVCRRMPRNPITPIADADIFSVLSYTGNLLNACSPDTSQTFAGAVFKYFDRMIPTEGNAAAFYDLIATLMLIRPYTYFDRLWVIVSENQSEFWSLSQGKTNLHIQLLGLYSALHDGQQSDAPDRFSALLVSLAGRHPAPEQFLEFSLLHFQQKAPQDYFAFAHHLTEAYGRKEFTYTWIRAFQTLLRDQTDMAYHLVYWFAQLRSQLPEKNAVHNEWYNDLRLTLSIWLEQKQFYQNNPFVILLYAQLIAGIKPPLAKVLAMLCDLKVVQNYPNLQNEIRSSLFYLTAQSVRIFGAQSDVEAPINPQLLGVKRPLYPDYTEYLYTVEKPVILTNYSLSRYQELFDKSFLTADVQRSYVRNVDLLTKLFNWAKTVSDSVLDPDSLYRTNILLQIDSYAKSLVRPLTRVVP